MQQRPVETAEQWERYYPFISWLIHGGGAAVGGLSARAFTSIEVQCRDLIRRVAPTAFQQVADALHIPKTVPDFQNMLDFVVTEIETLCVIDAQLQTLGRPSRFGA